MLVDLEMSQTRVVGTKQTLKELEQDKVKKVFIARDADGSLKDRITSIAQAKETEIIYVSTMEELGQACNIEVGAATAAILEE